MQAPSVEWTSATHAIVVCGHAVYTGGVTLQPTVDAELDEYWTLQSFQQGEGKYFIDHIRSGVELAAEDNSSLLIFSGGQTRYPEILSEAQGYFQIAQLFNFFEQTQVRSRTTTEEFSRDSYDNVLFSLARFYECTGRFPEHLTIISWLFKQKRFQHHATTVSWPMHRFTFFGIGTPDDLQAALTSEARALSAFKADPAGTGKDGTSLGKKKASRNPYRRQHGYETSCTPLAPILRWTAATPFPTDQVPWSMSK